MYKLLSTCDSLNPALIPSFAFRSHVPPLTSAVQTLDLMYESC